AGMVLTDAVLQSLSGGLVASAGNIDVAGQIMMKDTLSVDDRCTTWPTAATQDPTQVSLRLDGTDLVLEIVVPNLDVQFQGECMGLFSQIPIGGEMSMSIVTDTVLTPQGGSGCLSAFDHSAPDVQLPGWQFDVWGEGGPLQNGLVDLGSSGKSQQAHDQFAQEFQTQADTLLTQKLG